MSEDTYNGWTNRETWALSLWIDNEQGWHEQIRELVTDAAREHDNEQRDECTGCIQGSHSEDCATDLDALTPYPAHEAGDLIRESVESLLDPDQYLSEFGTAQPVEVARIAYDVGSLYRVNWAEMGEAYLAD